MGGSINAISLTSSIWAADTWIILVIAIIFGALGGRLAHMINSSPERKKPWFNYVIVGAAASVAVLFISVPIDAIRLIAQSLAAGYAGKAVLSATEARVDTALAKTEASNAKKDTKLAIEAGKTAIESAQRLVPQHPDLALKNEVSSQLSTLFSGLELLEEKIKG